MISKIIDFWKSLHHYGKVAEIIQLLVPVVIICIVFILLMGCL
jgi:hypothetical protein